MIALVKFILWCIAAYFGIGIIITLIGLGIVGYVVWKTRD